MTHEQKAKAYNLGWNRVRCPGDRRFHVAAPRNSVLADYFYQGMDDARRSMMVRQAELDAYHDATLARDGEVIEIGDGGYGSGCCYGGDILQALAVIVGVKIESV